MKEEKLKAVDDALPAGASVETIAAKFKEMYPDDWGRIVARYKRRERYRKPGKTHSMPEPETYLLKMVKTYKTAVAKSKT